MFDCIIKIKINKSEPLWKSDRLIYLLAINVSSIPNHVAIVHNGKYYDLGFKKKNIGVDFGEVLNKLKRKNIPTLFFECKTTERNDIDSIINQIFSIKKNW